MTASSPTHAPLDPGLWVILATPFGPDGELDLDSTTRQVRVALDAGADGLVALGVFGEAASLSLAEQRRVAGCVVAAAPGARIVLGVSGRSTAVVVEQGLAAVEAAVESGASRERLSLMVQVATTDPEVLHAHLIAVHEAVGVGLVVQDYPATTGVRIPAAVLADVVARCDFVVAVKAEAPPTPPAIATLVAGCRVPVFGGLGGVGLVDELAAGAAGAMTGFSAPEGLRATLDAFSVGGFAAARRVWSAWLPLATFEAQPPIALGLRKELMHRRGVLAHPGVRPPAPTWPRSLEPLLDDHLRALEDLAPPTTTED